MTVQCRIFALKVLFFSTFHYKKQPSARKNNNLKWSLGEQLLYANASDAVIDWDVHLTSTLTSQSQRAVVSSQVLRSLIVACISHSRHLYSSTQTPCDNLSVVTTGHVQESLTDSDSRLILLRQCRPASSRHVPPETRTPPLSLRIPPKLLRFRTQSTHYSGLGLRVLITQVQDSES